MAKNNITTISTASSTFGHWLDKTNELVSLVNTDIVTASSQGDTTDGNVILNGDISVIDASVSGTFEVGTISAHPSSLGSIKIDTKLELDGISNKQLTLKNISGPIISVNNNTSTWNFGLGGASSSSPFVITTEGSAQNLFSLSTNGLLNVSGIIGNSMTIDNLSISNGSITSINNDSNIVLSPNGTGKIDVDNSIISNISLPVDDNDATNKIYVDEYLQGTNEIAPDLGLGLWKIDGTNINVTSSELNKLSGVTWNFADFNNLVSTITELNHLSGITENVQEKFDSLGQVESGAPYVSDWNDAIDCGFWAGSTNALNSPNNNTFYRGIVSRISENAVSQLLISSNGSDMYVRSSTLGVWGGWSRIPVLIDEDNLSSNDSKKAPSQQSVKTYVDAGDSTQIGVGQTWKSTLHGDIERQGNNTYKNETGKPIQVIINVAETFDHPWIFRVSMDTHTWRTIVSGDGGGLVCAIIPNGAYYDIKASISMNDWEIDNWAELR